MDSTTTKSTTKIPEIDNGILPTNNNHQPKILSFTNGVLKRHHHHHHPTSGDRVIYKECLKNHAASLGGHALDGCGEFMSSPTSIPTDPTSLKCAACGCHRNFHRRDPEEGTHYTDFHHPPPHPPAPAPAVPRGRSPNSSSPPPISSSYYPSAPHMLLALSSGLTGPPSDNHPTATINGGGGGGGRKRNRTKFSREQKEKMYLFSEKLDWKIQKRDEGMVEEFCNEIGVERGVLKVWMHNNKHTYGKRDVNGSSSNNNNNTNNLQTNFNYNHQNDGSSTVHVTTNCSSSSS